MFLDQSNDWMSFFFALTRSGTGSPNLNCSCIGVTGDVELVSIDFKTFPISIPAVIKKLLLPLWPRDVSEHR